MLKRGAIISFHENFTFNLVKASMSMHCIVVTSMGVSQSYMVTHIKDHVNMVNATICSVFVFQWNQWHTCMTLIVHSNIDKVWKEKV